MRIKTVNIKNSLSLNRMELEVTNAPKVISGKNIVFAIDVSGSMSYELPKIRTQLKNKIPDLVGVNDTISIIWFSGKGQCGVLKEGVSVKNLLDIQKLNDAIDRFLVPICLTAFLPPLELTEKLISNLSSNGNPFSFIFLSDGYNNDSNWSSVVKALESLEPKLLSSTYIEYGYYADSNALSKMAELTGGEKIFSKDFDSYDVDIHKIMKKDGATKRLVDIKYMNKSILCDFIYSIDKDSNSINVYTTKEKDDILVPENVDTLYYFSNVTSPKSDTVGPEEILAGTYILADKLKYNYVEDLLAYVGDIDLIKMFSGAYGKQKLNDLKDKLRELVFDQSGLYVNGKDTNYVIDDNEYCFMDLIKDLQDGDCYFYPYHELFNYNRVSSKKVTKVELTDEQKDALAKAKTLNEITKITQNVSVAEFVYPENADKIAMSFNTLVWNQDRANLSVQTKLNGKVKLPKNDYGLDEIESFIYRNYTLVKDGIVNVSTIPVSLDSNTYNKLDSIGIIKFIDGVCCLDLSNLPTINRSMAINPSAVDLANLEFDLIKLQVNQKYLKYLKDLKETETGTKNKSIWSDEIYEWFKSIGITDNGGFAPKTESVKSEDFYVAPVLKVKIEKTSTVPKITDYIKKKESGKSLNVIESILSLRESETKDILGDDYTLEDVIAQISKIDKHRRNYLTEIAKIKFGVILSRSWFKEFESMEQNELSLNFDEVDSGELKVLFDYKEEEIKI